MPLFVDAARQIHGDGSLFVRLWMRRLTWLIMLLLLFFYGLLFSDLFFLCSTRHLYTAASGSVSTHDYLQVLQAGETTLNNQGKKQQEGKG